MTSLQRQRVLVIDDDPNVAEVVAAYLEREGCIVEVRSDGEAGLQAALADPPDLVVLDLMLPGLDGLEVCRRLQALAPVPVVMLTAKGDETDRIIGLELGADDYVSKPFSPRELVARIKAVLRRAELPPPSPRREIVVDDRLRLDFERREVLVDGQQVQLRPTEFRLLYHLATNPGAVLSHETLLSRVWGPEYRDAGHYLRLYINYLRQKIEPDPANPVYILTARGVGYRFVDYTAK